MTFITSMTSEQRNEALAKAALAREATKAEREANEHLYKTTYMDSNYWQELAQKFSVRMPVYNQPCTVKLLKKYLKKLEIPVKDWQDACGLNTLQHFISINPKMTMCAALGNLLEYKNDVGMVAGKAA